MALAQTEGIARLLRAADPALDVEIVKFETRGDQDQTSKLLRHGGKGGAFVAEIREAMRGGELQAAMHSLKDVPGNEETPGLIIAATLPRDAANDALVLRPGLSLDAFRASKGKGFKIGTNAVRRAAYLRRLFPEVTVIHFRGAADTRVAKLDRGDKQRLPDGGEVGPADALVMARSRSEEHTSELQSHSDLVCRLLLEKKKKKKKHKIKKKKKKAKSKKKQKKKND